MGADPKVALRFVPQNGTRSRMFDDYEGSQQKQDSDSERPLIEQMHLFLPSQGIPRLPSLRRQGPELTGDPGLQPFVGEEHRDIPLVFPVGFPEFTHQFPALPGSPR